MWWSDRTLLRSAVIGCTLAMASAVASCGFQPMYARSNNGDALKNALAAVSIEVIENREGQMLRNALERRFARGAGNADQKRFTLRVTMTEQKVASAFRKDATNTRESLTLNTLSTLSSGNKVIWTHEDSALTAYNVTADHYSVEMAYRGARERAIEQLADAISEAVAVYIKQNPNYGLAPAGTRP